MSYTPASAVSAVGRRGGAVAGCRTFSAVPSAVSGPLSPSSPPANAPSMDIDGALKPCSVRAAASHTSLGGLGISAAASSAATFRVEYAAGGTQG